jgi:dolichyl-phosphate beta-glucosyltransferase
MIKSLSIIIPFFNEEKRINSCLLKILNFYKKIKNKIKIEVIFVDDGSNDNSKFLIKNFINNNNINSKILFLKKNSGKGKAIRTGIQKANHKWVLTCDLDMSVSLFQLLKWLKNNYIDDNYEIYFGSRQHIRSNVDAKFYRSLLGKVLQALIKVILKIKIKDTQCGFKLYKTKIAKLIFNKLKNSGFEHDLEIILLANNEKKKIKELPVKWKHVPNSKINILIHPILMLIGIFILKFRYFK